ncbi:MAG: hypothetical protein H6Q90_1951 [Deltaproteobacteria bacterium]|nr:hypothetical protein [Deltaproteobacteria bacterium]
MRIALMTSLLAIGCTASGPGDDVTGGDDPVGTPTNPQPAKTGPYQMRNTIDFTIEAILPPQAELVVATIRDFSTNPAHALITIADKAGVPAVGALYNAIPGIIKDRLEGFINDEINKIKINDKPLTEYAGEMAALADIALTQFSVDSELDIKRGAPTTHQLTALDLHPAGIDFRLPLGNLPADTLLENPRISVGDGGKLTFSEQHFGLAYGEYAWQALEAISTQTFGQDIRGTLGKALNCPVLAKSVADKCVLGVCVGHETEIASICSVGLDLVVSIAHDQMSALRLDVLHFASGTATLVDEDGDGVGDKVVDGTWNAELNLGLGLRHAPAAFEGSR